MRTGAIALGIAIGCAVARLAAAPQDHAPSQDDSQKIELPEGEGKMILQTACTTCHTLKEVTKFKGYYNREDWADIVRTMIEYGAKLDDAQASVLIDYLTKNFGPVSNEAPR